MPCVPLPVTAVAHVRCLDTVHRITAAVRSLQMLVPTDRRVLEDVSQLTQVGVVWCGCVLRFCMLPAIYDACKYPPMQDSTEDLSVSHGVIQRLFDPASNSPMQLLYSFEVLSGQILPVHEEDGRETSAQDFRKQFLRAGGLKFVINILQKNALPQDVEVKIRQDCYAIALFLARYDCAPSQNNHLASLPHFVPSFPSAFAPSLPSTSFPSLSSTSVLHPPPSTPPLLSPHFTSAAGSSCAMRPPSRHCALPSSSAAHP